MGGLAIWGLLPHWIQGFRGLRENPCSGRWGRQTLTRNGSNVSMCSSFQIRSRLSILQILTFEIDTQLPHVKAVHGSIFHSGGWQARSAASGAEQFPSLQNSGNSMPMLCPEFDPALGSPVAGGDPKAFWPLVSSLWVEKLALPSLPRRPSACPDLPRPTRRPLSRHDHNRPLHRLPEPCFLSSFRRLEYRRGEWCWQSSHSFEHNTHFILFATRALILRAF